MESEQMICLKCGHIAQIGDEYNFYTGDGEEDYPICPQCGEYNIGGYPSYSAWCEMSEEDRETFMRQIEGADPGVRCGIILRLLKGGYKWKE